MRVLGALGGAGGITATIAALGWPGVAVVVGLTVLILGSAAWVLADLDRTYCLALVITAWRGTDPAMIGLEAGPQNRGMSKAAKDAKKKR